MNGIAIIFKFFLIMSEFRWSVNSMLPLLTTDLSFNWTSWIVIQGVPLGFVSLWLSKNKVWLLWEQVQPSGSCRAFSSAGPL